jgi:hypothetical protein
LGIKTNASHLGTLLPSFGNSLSFFLFLNLLAWDFYYIRNELHQMFSGSFPNQVGTATE